MHTDYFMTSMSMGVYLRHSLMNGSSCTGNGCAGSSCNSASTAKCPSRDRVMSGCEQSAVSAYIGEGTLRRMLCHSQEAALPSIARLELPSELPAAAALAFVPGSKKLLLATCDARVLLIDPDTSEVRLPFTIPGTSTLKSICKIGFLFLRRSVQRCTSHPALMDM